jgi:hypothetical protein
VAIASVVVVASLVGVAEIAGNPLATQEQSTTYSVDTPSSSALAAAGHRIDAGNPATPRAASRRSLSSGSAAGRSSRSAPNGTSRESASRLGSAPVVADIGASGARLIIPSLGVDATLVPTGAVGAPGSASLTIPADVHTVAWWDGSVRDGARTVHEDAPRPGQPGVALIAGHVDSAAAGPGALFDLKALEVGAVVDVVDSDHRRSTWIVSSPPETALKTALPPALWVTSGAPKLALVTCGGPFDASTGHYLDNVIVWARPDAPDSVGTRG